jgi:hypothetical protein
LCQLPAQRTDLETARSILDERTINLLVRQRFRTVEELAATPDRALLGLHNLGAKAMIGIHHAVIALHNGSLNVAPTPTIESASSPTPQLDGLSTRQLLSLWAASLRELRRRGVVRTLNNPIGDVAEDLVCRHYSGERAGFSQKAWDVQVGDERLQVISLRQTGTRPRRTLSPIRSEDYTPSSSSCSTTTCASSRPCACPTP